MRNEEIIKTLFKKYGYIPPELDKTGVAKEWLEILDAKDAELALASFLETKRRCEVEAKLQQVRDLVLDDVPHQYQKRLLEILK